MAVATPVGPIATTAAQLSFPVIERYLNRLASGERASEKDLQVSGELIRNYLVNAPQFAESMVRLCGEVAKRTRDENLQQVEFLLKQVDDPALQAIILREGAESQRSEMKEFHKTLRTLGLGALAGGSLLAAVWVHRPDRRSLLEKVFG